jgi:lipoprotein-releasing system permease protein
MASPFALSVALRQLTHNRGQTLLTIGVVATSVTLILFVSSLINGLQIRLVSTITDSIPHLRIMPVERAPEVLWDRPEAQASPVFVGTVPKLEQRQRKIEGWKPWLERIGALEPLELTALLPSVDGPVVVSRESKRISARLIGALPEQYNRIVDLQGNMAAGRFFGLNGGEAVIGVQLARELGVHLGDRISLLSAEGIVASATIAGIYDTGFGALDQTTVFVPLRDAQSLLQLGNAITGFAVKVRDVFTAEKIAGNLRQQLPFKIESWMEDNERTLSGLKAQDGSSQMIIAFTTVSAGLAIAALMVISVSRKYREIGILKAMGASNGQILRIFALQGLILSVMGALIGTFVSLALLGWLSGLQTVAASTGRPTDLFPIAFTIGNFLVGNGLAVATGLVASIYPASQASKVDPIEVIRGQ